MAWYNRGSAYNELHQYDKAVTDFSKVIELDPKHVRAWTNRGVAYNELHQYEKAIADLTKATELDPKNGTVWRNRGYAYSELHQYDKAVTDFSKVIELDPNSAPAWNDRGVAYLRLRQYDKALADFKKTLELAPTDPVGQNNLAWLLAACPEAKLRDPTRAVQLAENIVKGAPGQALFRTTLGVARYRADDWKGAALTLEEALKLLQATHGFDRGVGRSLFFLAMAQHRLGHGKEARQAYDRARAWLETNRKTVQGTPWLAEELRRWQTEAEELLKQRPEKKHEPPAEAPRR